MSAAFWAGLNSYQNRHLTAGTTAPFARLPLAANIGVIELNHPLKRIAGIPVLHGLADLMTPTPRRRIRDTQIILELTGGGTRGSGGHKKDGPKPVPQRLSGLVEDGMGGQRSLVTTVLALIFAP